MIFKTMAINYERNTRSQYELFDRQTSFQLKMLIISKNLPIYIQRAIGANHSKPITCKKFQMSFYDHKIFRMASWYIEVYESGIDFSLSLLDFVQHGN